jgi:hypothetical protein
MCPNPALNERVKETIFMPLLEENTTKEVESESEDGDDPDARYKKIAPDGSTIIDYIKKDKEKLSRDKEIKEMIRTDYEFPNFNITHFAENYIFKYASSEETVNSDKVYQLYDIAIKLEPKPKKRELTY